VSHGRGFSTSEKSLALTGEIIEANSVWQGCPAWFQYERQSDSDDAEEGIHIEVDIQTRLLQGMLV